MVTGPVSFGSQLGKIHRLRTGPARQDWPAEGGFLTCSGVQRPMTHPGRGVGHMQLAKHFPSHDVTSDTGAYYQRHAESGEVCFIG